MAEHFLCPLIGEQQLARRGLRDDHAERQLAHERGQPLALAMHLLVERAVVEGERDAPRDLPGQLLLILVGECRRLPAERECAERAAAHQQWYGQHRPDADPPDRDAVLGTAVGGVR